MNETKNQMTPEQETLIPMEEALKTAEERLPNFEPGEIIDAKVVLVRDDAAFVDIGGKSDYSIPLAELTAESAALAQEVVKTGDLIKVMVVRTEEEDKISLSKRRADERLVWLDLQEAFNSQSLVSGTVSGVVKGGLNVNLNGVKAFMPASHAVLEQTKNLESLVGQTFDMNILELDLAKKRVLVSRRKILEEERRKIEAEFFENIKEGERRKGKVTKILNFGAFVDLGSGIEGLIHISELSWNRVKNAAEVLNEGDEVEVLVTKVDPEKKRLSLSLKQIEEHPWDRAIKDFTEGAVYQGTVVRLEPFGAFIRLAPGVEGLAHISQLAEKRVNNPEEVLSVGQEVQVKIIKIDPSKRKVSLSLKQVASDREKEQLHAYLKQHQDQPFVQNLGDFIKTEQ